LILTKHLFLTRLILEFSNKIIIVLLTCLISIQTGYQLYNSLKFETTAELVTSPESDREAGEGETDGTESLDYLIHTNEFVFSNALHSISFHPIVSFAVPSFHQKVPIPPPEA